MIDARDFERGLAAPPGDPQQLAALLDRYRGEFLAGFALPDVEDFESWLNAERERYRRLALRGLAALAQLHSDRGEYPVALDAIERALALDPLQEEAQRAAMRLRYLTGDRAGAIRRFEQLRRLLDDELGVPPLAETQALYDAIITDSLADDRRPSRQTTEPTAESEEPGIRGPSSRVHDRRSSIARSRQAQQLSCVHRCRSSGAQPSWICCAAWPRRAGCC